MAYFKEIVLFCLTEILKPNIEKKNTILNKALILSGDTGIGKSSFINKFIKPIFEALPVDMDKAFQPAHILKESVKVLYSTDDAHPSTFYNYTLVANGDLSLDIK